MKSKCLAPLLALGFAGALLGLVGALLTGCASTADQEELFRARTISFDLSEVGRLPRNFTTALTGDGPVSWVVREDAESPDGKPVLVQESAEGTNDRFPLCVYDKVVARDLMVEAQFKALSGKVDQSGGIVLRYTPDNYYMAQANSLENNMILFKTVNGQRSKIVEIPVKVSGGVWHTLRFEAKGARLKVYFDGKRVIDHADNTFLNPGKVGLCTKADSVSAFTGLKIEPVR
jgi:Domain of Unknown Function (DUF1080)